MCKLDLKDAYLSIPIHKSSRKFLKFHWQGVAYEYTALPFGLSAAPRTFTKVLKPVLAALRAKGIRLVAYLDDILNIGKDKECAEEAFQTTRSYLQALGFVVNLEKSQSQAAQEIEVLGFIINSREMTFRIPTARVKQIKNDTKRILQKEQVTVRELAHIVGVLASTRLAVLPAPLHYRALQGQKNEGLHHHLSYESMVTLSSQSREDLQWWINHLSRNNGRPIHHLPPNMVIESDASDTGWGACYEGLTTRVVTRGVQITHQLQRVAGSLPGSADLCEKQEKDAHQTSSRQYDSHVLYQHSLQLMQLTSQFWNWSLERDILISAEHLPGRQNQIADQESRMQGDSSEWKLKPVVFWRLMEQLGPCQIDLFASRLTTQLEKYMSWKLDLGAVATDALSQEWIIQGSLSLAAWLVSGNLSAEEISEAASRLILASWRENTERSYSSCWKRWEKWSAKHGHEVICAPLSAIREFLTSEFLQGKEYRTINSYRSAVSMTHSPIDGVVVGKHPLVSRLLKGIYNRRPPQPRYFTTWDVAAVLDHIRSWGPTKSLCKKKATLKLAMLMA